MRTIGLTSIATKLLAISLALGLAMLAVAGERKIELAEGSACTDKCFAQERSCLMATKNKATCDAQLLRCLQGCR